MSNAMGSFANYFISRFIHSRVKSVMQWLARPQQCQQEILQYLIAANQQTEWGKMHNFTGIRNANQFARQIPIQDYNSLKPYIDRTMNGQQGVLWHQPVTWFAKSSGTTAGKSKFLPLTKQAIYSCHIAGSRDIMALYIHNNPGTKLFSGKTLILGGSSSVHQLNPHSRYGDLSAVLLQHMPPLGNFLRTPPLNISLLPDWNDKIEQTARLAIKQHITGFAGVPTWFLVLFKQILEITGKNNLAEVWPGLELYLHGGVSFTPYTDVFSRLIPLPNMQYWQTYNASEGFFAIQDQPGRTDMALLLNHGIYYEFLPMTEFDSPNPITLQLHEVELGKNYAIVISTNAGLWRYLPGDTIAFTSTNPYRIRVTGRTRHYINAFGEELIVDNADEAIHHACRQTNATVQEYTAAPVYLSETGKGGHEWLVEFAQLPHNLPEFVQQLDTRLQAINSDYEAKRFNNLAMQLPVVTPVPEGTFYRWLQSKGKLGGQHKIPRLSNDRHYIDEIKQFSAAQN